MSSKWLLSQSSEYPNIGVSEIPFVTTQELIRTSISQNTQDILLSTVWWKKTSEYYSQKFHTENLQWISSPIDIYDCELEKIQSKQYIHQYIQELCNGMWWEMIWTTYVKYFNNEDPWITFKQRTNQGLVSGHFKDNTLWACIDIHSRDFHDPNLVAEFSTRYFNWNSTELDVSYRPPLNNKQTGVLTEWWTKNTEYYQSKYESKNVWWMNTALDIDNCDLLSIAKSKNLDVHLFIKNFILDLCDYINMVRDWDPELHDIDHHWESGLEFTQVITTSLISGHFRHSSKTAYLEIFSCKFYDPNDVAKFTKNYFSAWNTQMQVTYRWIDG
jgi:hypothetical protein